MKIHCNIFPVINAEKGALHAPDFKGKLIRTRKEMLADITKDYNAKAKEKRRRSGNPTNNFSRCSYTNKIIGKREICQIPDSLMVRWYF